MGKRRSEGKYDWVRDGARYCKEDNCKLPWGVDVKFHNGGYGKTYHASLNKALKFIRGAEIVQEFPF